MSEGRRGILGIERRIQTMKQVKGVRCMGVRLMAAVLSALPLFSLSGCFFFTSGDEETGNIRENMVGYLESGDVERFYQNLSPAAEEQQEDLMERIKEVSEFVQNEVVSWEQDVDNLPSTSVQDGMVKRSYSWSIKFQTSDGEYGGLIIDVANDDYDPQNVGIYSLAVYPDDLGLLCGVGHYDTLDRGYDDDRAGIFLFFREEQPDEPVVDRLLALAEMKDSGGVCDLFSQYAKDNTDDLPEMAENVLAFLDRPFLSCQFFGCVSEQVYLPGIEEKVIKRHAMYVLETDERNYLLHLRDLLRSGEDGENLGLYSIAICAEEHAREYKNLGWLEPGIFVKELTMDTELEGIQNSVATLVLSTSIEAEVTSDSKTVIPKQVDALTWTATIPTDERESCIFTATAGDESVEQYISTTIRDGEELVIIYDKYELYWPSPEGS